MKKYSVYGIVTGTRYLGHFEANSKEEAIATALESEKNHVSICHQCNDEIELDDISCHEAIAEEVTP